MSKYWGVHNDEDEVAYSSEHPKVRYEYKQAKCRLSQKTSSTDLKNFFTHTKSLSMPKRKGTTSRVSIQLSKKRLKVVMTI